MNPLNSTAADLAPIEELDRNILTLCARINAATYELLILIREFDERAGWLKWGLKNCAEWLAWRCDFSMTTALEKVRVAHAMKTHPVISRAFASGELSYSKVRAITRVANRDNERELVEKALDKARDNEGIEIPDLVDTSWSTRQADAFVNMLNGFLSGNRSDAPANDNYLVTVHVDQSALAGDGGRSALPVESVKRLCCDGYAVVITENERGEPLNIGRKTRVVPTAIQRALRARDNNCCTFPGCRNRRYLHSHHVEHWSNGGETSLDNLMLLCTKHHTLVHEGGFRIEKDFQDRWYFKRPDGIAVPGCGYQSRDIVDTGLSDSYEIPPRGGLLSVAEKTSAEPPPPVYRHRTTPLAA